MFECSVLSLFPGLIVAYAKESILGRAQSQGIFRLHAVDIRAFAAGKHRVVDDVPYGGGAGMLMKVEPLVGAIEASRRQFPNAPIWLMGPCGRRFNREVARELAGAPGVVLVCGRYEGIDERVRAHIDGELSIGDYILTGGELAALCVMDAVVRLLPRALGNEASASFESFEDGLLEYPHYTRPPTFRGVGVPKVLLSGNHAHIAAWRRWQSLRRTQAWRPDLLVGRELCAEERRLLEQEEDVWSLDEEGA
ncbi:MAG: tRNA (guanosine(37)-N1)-methyltransferase TrmD [Proteobacteria bacterium]|nr:tRNA (guanosine(37)-N1)-methyltransferase TrmD [Cystobacterineae bacterium]MCL2314554.1 tRNA (guanosine(37)-N1)-methyltransferase TrmD [Pseudomonadota bacterium]